MDMPQRAGDGVPLERRSRGFLQKKIQCTFSVGRLLAFLLFGGGMLIWIFFFGILLGRGLNPEEKLPELAGLMPAAQPTSSGDDASGDAPDTAPSSVPASGMLRPDELAYHNSLKGTGPSPRPAAPGGASARNTRPATPSPAASAVRSAALVIRPGTPATQSAPAREEFTYIYQVAAFKGSGPAEALRKRLQATGIRSSVEKQASGSTTWYKTLVHFNGEPDDIRLLREKLSTMGIDRILLRSKKPVTP